jgi:hypothetical protein
MKEPANMGKKTIIVNQGKLLMIKIKETLNGKPMLKTKIKVSMCPLKICYRITTTLMYCLPM